MNQDSCDGEKLLAEVSCSNEKPKDVSEIQRELHEEFSLNEGQKLPVPNLRYILPKHCENNKSSQSSYSQNNEIFLFVCPLCNDKFTEKTDLKKHFETHVSNPTTCSICKQQSEDMFHHVHTKHKSMKNHSICLICDKRFANWSVLSGHFRSIHLGQTFRCPICDKTISITNKSRHKREMHDNRRKKCQYCDKEFAPSNMRRHVRHFHLNETKECPHCRRHLTLSNLSKHIKQVHMNMIKTCDICNDDFSISAISVHKRKVHGIGKPIGEVTPRGPNWKLRARKEEERNRKNKEYPSEEVAESPATWIPYDQFTSIQVQGRNFYFSST